PGSVATGEDPTSVAIASIQSAATFPDPGVKYVFRTEGGGTQSHLSLTCAQSHLSLTCPSPVPNLTCVPHLSLTCPMSHLSLPCPQAVIQGAFTSEEQVDAEAAPSETHYTYFPAAGVADGAAATAATAATAVVTTQSSEALLGQP
ncbi:USF1 factor, partial [Emberiza fucata]|nr:USF1 factor [Emberiza fucata]